MSDHASSIRGCVEDEKKKKAKVMNFDADCCESMDTLCGLVLPPGV